MTRLFGYIFASIGLAGFIFFISYSGTKFPLKELWFVLCIFIGIYGAFLIIKTKFRSNNNNQGVNLKALSIGRLKQNGDKIKLTLEMCEVKSRTFHEENISVDFPTSIEMIDGIYNSNRNNKTKEIQQTYIVYFKKYGDITYKFVSQAINTSSVTLKNYIDKQGVDLYVEDTNPKNYYFDLPIV